MRPEVVAEVREWLERAADDLREAEHDLGAAPPLLRGAVFHCQQAAEKALKGFLAEHERPFRRSHDLDELGMAVVALDSTLGGRGGSGEGSDTVRVEVPLSRRSSCACRGRNTRRPRAGQRGLLGDHRPPARGGPAVRHPVLAGLLMLRQSVLNPDRSTPFVLTSDLGIDLGSYEDLVFGDMVKGHVARSLAKAGVAAYLRHTLALTVDDAKEVRRRLARGTP